MMMGLSFIYWHHMDGKLACVSSKYLFNRCVFWTQKVAFVYWKMFYLDTKSSHQNHILIKWWLMVELVFENYLSLFNTYHFEDIIINNDFH